MFYAIYKIINSINGMIYIGAHKTSDLNDGYMGSGTYLNHAQTKYGLENFTKEILEVFETQEEMFDAESIIVNEEFVNRTDTYNLKIGGHGGFDFINKNLSEKEILKRNSKNSPFGKDFLKGREYIREEKSIMMSTLHKEGKIPYVKSFLGKKHSEESKLKMSKTKKDMGFQLGESNSQFGTIWIYNLEEKLSKKIKKEEFPEYENLGWLKGRKMKDSKI